MYYYSRLNLASLVIYRYVCQLVEFSFTSFMVLCKPHLHLTLHASPPWISGLESSKNGADFILLVFIGAIIFYVTGLLRHPRQCSCYFYLVSRVPVRNSIRVILQLLKSLPALCTFAYEVPAQAVTTSIYSCQPVTRMCQHGDTHAKVCKSMHKYVEVCRSVLKCVEVCRSV